MKKRIPYLIFIAIYLVSLSAGFLIAGVNRASANFSSVEDSRQTNWVLIRVNDLTLEKPQLVSIWAMFLTFSTGPQLFFKPIYSAEWAGASSSAIARKFSITSDRSLSSQFVAELNLLKIRRSGLVILDNEGFENFTSWFKNDAGAKVDKSWTIPAQGKTAIRSPETSAYSQVCDVLQSKQSLPQVDLPWKKLAPNHLLPNPNLESLVAVWSQVILSSTPVHCEVIFKQ